MLKLVSMNSFIGNRPVNEDYYCLLDNGFSMADGIHAKDAAQGSKVACKHFVDNPPNKETVVREFDRVNKRLVRLSAKRKSKIMSTLTVGWMEGDMLHWTSVGDTAIYMIRNDNAVLLNTLHLYSELNEKHKNNPAYANRLYSVLGDTKIDNYCTGKIELEDGDELLVCTDGIYQSDALMNLCVVAPDEIDANKIPTNSTYIHFKYSK